MTGWQTLFYKEVLRFWKVSFQTVAAPVLTAVLYLLIFGHVLEDHVKVYDRISYTAFLVPGLVMMLHKPLGMTCSHKESGKLFTTALAFSGLHLGAIDKGCRSSQSHRKFPAGHQHRFCQRTIKDFQSIGN